MIDIHTHILPNVDDGAKDEIESHWMLKNAMKDGIHTVVATPHFHHDHPRFSLESPKVIKRVERLRKYIQKHQLKINILPGQEVRIFGELIEYYEAGKILTIADKKSHMLIEFPFHEVPHYTEKLFYELNLREIVPIIAHPERNSDILKNPEKLLNVVEKGALTQLTAGSLLGNYGKDVQKFSHQLMENNLIHIIATDAHNVDKRPFNMNRAMVEVVKKYGEDQASYFINNAKSVALGKQVVIKPPKPVGKKKFFKST